MDTNSTNRAHSIPTRRELVKEAARNPNNTETKEKLLESQTYAWTYCPLSQRSLAPPIVSDCAGVLYSKDAIIEHLLPSDDASRERKAEHDEVLQGKVKSIRDVVEVKFEIVQDEKTKEVKRICPITAKELGASTKSVYLVPCGHAFAELAIREVPSETCMECNEPSKADDVITILPVVKEEISRMEERIARLREAGLTHSLKKAPGAKKRKKSKKNEEVQTEESQKKSGMQANGDVAKLKRKSPTGDATPSLTSGTATPVGGIKNAATASLTAKVMKEQEEKNKRRKMGMNDNLNSLFSTGKEAGKPSSGDFLTRGYSLPKKA